MNDTAKPDRDGEKNGSASTGRPIAGFANFQWPPPTDWQAFERLCCFLWRKIWKDPQTQMHGRPGQAQQGVDVYGVPAGQLRVHGIQCKRKDALLQTLLTEDEVLAEVENAKAFKPPLAQLIIATCTASDAHLQKLAREITEKHAAAGLFKVDILGWPEIASRLGEYPDVIAQVYGLMPIAEPTIAPDADRRAEMRHAEVMASNSSIQQRVEQVLAHVASATTPSDGPAHAQLDVCRDLLETHEYRSALRTLTRLREKEWSTATPAVRFRILTNLGAAHLGLGEYVEAANLFLEAFQHDDRSDKALTNRALALMLLDRPTEAVEAAQEAVSRYPKSALAWTAFLNIAARLKTNEPLPEVPEEIAEEPRLLLARADALTMRKSFGSAEALLRKVVALPSHDVMAESRLAEVLIAQVQAEGDRFYAGAPYSAEDMGRFDEARELIRTTWSAIKKSDLASGAVHIVQNFCAICTVMGRMREAEGLLDEALLIAPEDAGLLTWKTRLAAAAGNGEAARRAFQKLPPKVDGRAMLEAAALNASGDVAGAADVLERHIQSTSGGEASLDARCMFADMVCQADLPHATARFDALPEAASAKVVRATLIFARALREAGSSEAASEYLARARAQLLDTNDARDRLMLADALADFDDCAAAVAIYEKDVSLAIDTPSLREYCRCLLALDQRRKLTDLISRLPGTLLVTRPYEWIRANLAVRVSDFPAARASLARCLALDPEKLEPRLLWIDVCVRMHDLAAASEALQTIDVRSPDLTLEQLMRLGPIFHALKRPDEAAAVFYQALRRFPNDPRPHVALAVSIMTKGNKDWEPGAITVVAPDTTVGLRNSDGQDAYYVLEALPENELRTGEVAVSSDFGASLLGHRVGDVIAGHTSELATHESTVISIEHKFVHAMNASLRTFNTRFPQSPGLVGVKLPTTGTPDEQVAPILKAVSERANRVRQIEALYDQGLPVAALGVMLGRSSIETWQGLASRPDKFVLVCTGTPEEREEAVTLLQGLPRLILDTMTLYELHLMEALDAVAKTTGRLAVTAASLAELQGLVSDFELHRDGYSSIAEKDGTYYRQDVSAKAVEQQRSSLVGALEWARKNCDIAPALPRVDLAPESTDRMYDILGPAAYDTLLAAAGGDYILLSDDWHLRQLAKGEFGVRGVWVQALGLAGVARGSMRPDHYNRIVSMLASWRHHFTTITADHLYFAATRGGWRVTPEFLALAATLSLKHSEVRANFGVCAAFLKKLWQKRGGPSKPQARKLTQALIRALDLRQSQHGAAYVRTLRELVQKGELPERAWDAIVGAVSE